LDRHVEFYHLRRRLVAVYLAPTFDVDAAGVIATRLKEMLMYTDDSATVAKVRELYDAGLGAGAAARRLSLSRDNVLRYYHDFNRKGGRRVQAYNHGDPPLHRSALATHTPWVPKDDSKIIVAKPHTNSVPYQKREPKIVLGKLECEVPTTAAVAMAIVTAAKLVSAEPELVLTAGSMKGMASRPASHARTYAGFALLAAYPMASRALIAKLVGVPQSSRMVYFPAFEGREREGRASWFDRTLIAGIVAKIKEVKDGS
jgi:hypothetical protein